MIRRFTVVAGIVGIGGLVALVGLVGRDRRPVEDAQSGAVAVPAAPLSSASAPAVATTARPAPPRVATETVALRPRDTLASLLKRGGLSLTEAHALAMRLRQAGADLRRMRTGDRLELGRDPDGRIVTVAYAPTAWRRFSAARADAGWTVERNDVTPELRTEVRAGDVRNSLWDAVDAGAIAPQTMLELVQIFESDFDFAADTRRGDGFRLLVEARYANGTFVEDGRILAAQYVTADETLSAVAFEVDGRTAFYDLDGRSTRKMFLRSPLQFTRVSSGFTHARPHPVLGGVRPHLAIDYAAPAGTPVWAVADATVEFAGRNGGNGIQVLLRHRAGYRTYYNHLSAVARGVRAGGRVAQKQVIGYVGSTGLATGPHLDYRVSIDGRFVNPMNEKFLPGDPVPAGRRAAFDADARALLERLQPQRPDVPPADPTVEQGSSAPRPPT